MYSVAVSYRDVRVELRVDASFVGGQAGRVASVGACGECVELPAGGFESVVDSVAAGVVRGVERGSGVRYDLGSVGVVVENGPECTVSSGGVGADGLGPGASERQFNDSGVVEEDHLGSSQFSAATSGGSACDAGAPDQAAQGEKGATGGSDFCGRVGTEGDDGPGVARGVNFERNKAKRERKKKTRAMAQDWRSTVPVPSLSASVSTVGTRTVEEVEAARTLALRRIAENQVAEQLAKHRLGSLQDEKKTAAVRKLEAVRLDQRVNEARAKSQASYKKCGDSLKSLGSVGSAGELHLRQELAEAEAVKKKCKYLEEQCQAMLPLMPAHIRQRVADMEPPVFPSKAEIFGDCPDDYTEDEQQAYYDWMNKPWEAEGSGY